MGPAAGSVVALLDQHNKRTASDKSAASSDVGENQQHVQCSVISTLLVEPV